MLFNLCMCSVHQQLLLSSTCFCLCTVYSYNIVQHYQSNLDNVIAMYAYADLLDTSHVVCL